MIVENGDTHECVVTLKSFRNRFSVRFCSKISSTKTTLIHGLHVLITWKASCRMHGSTVGDCSRHVQFALQWATCPPCMYMSFEAPAFAESTAKANWQFIANPFHLSFFVPAYY